MTAFPDGWSKLARIVCEKRDAAQISLAKGAWPTEAKARELVGRFNALDEIFQEMAGTSDADGAGGKDL